ncbi:MAG: transglycosylase family protein [Candidatus Limnocylindria bacterium]
MRRILVLAAISVGGLALLAPLAARSATPLPIEIGDGLLTVADAPRPLVDRGGLPGRQGLLTASTDVQQVAEELEANAIPTPAAVPMEATLHSVATPAPTPAPRAPAPQRVVTYDGDTVWDDLAECESSGNWAINTGNGYYGGLQFSLGTWESYGGAEFAAYPHEATREEQIAIAERLRAARGYQPWPACRAKLGLP